ncbi:MAG: 3-keto-5-aminohexanoate cleavage protein [Nocardioides sp.]
MVGDRHRPLDAGRGPGLLSKGGHLRVGMEDVLTLSRGVLVESNRQLVERAAALGAMAQRTPMTPAECRVLLGIADGG